MTRCLAALLAMHALITLDLAICHQSQAIAAWGWVVAVVAGWIGGRSGKEVQNGQ